MNYLAAFKKIQRKRLATLTTITLIAALGAAAVLTALNQHIQLFYTPLEITQGKAPLGPTIKMGGLVVEGTIKRNTLQPLAISFDVSDLQQTVKVEYEGILPDLFRPGQGVVVEGRLTSPKTFRATQVLAKHDENYRPPVVDRALKKSYQAAFAARA